MSACGCDCEEPDRYVGVLLRRGTTVYGPWFERKADCIRSTVDLIAFSGIDLTVHLMTKGADDDTDGDEVDSTRTISLSTVQRKAQDWGPPTGIGLKQRVRYKIVTGTGSLTGWVLFRVLGPCWFDTVGVNVPWPAAGGGF